jgi:hypothetical protein
MVTDAYLRFALVTVTVTSRGYCLSSRQILAADRSVKISESDDSYFLTHISKSIYSSMQPARYPNHVPCKLTRVNTSATKRRVLDILSNAWSSTLRSILVCLETTNLADFLPNSQEMQYHHIPMFARITLRKFINVSLENAYHHLT